MTLILVSVRHEEGGNVNEKSAKTARILEALRQRYEAILEALYAHIAEAHATINIYLTNSVGIGEHPQHLEEVDKQLDKISQAEEKLDALEDFYEQTEEE